MPNTLFFTFPNDDLTLSYLYSYEKEVVRFAQQRGVSVTEFKREKATRKVVEKFLKAKNPDLVVFNGHGDENTVTGYRQEPIIIRGENESLLDSSIVYSISCSSAKRLGPSAVEKGAKAFIGYSDDFVFLFDKNRTATPLKDEIAKNFLEPSNALVVSLLKGNNIQESFDSSQKSFQKKIDRLLSSEAMPGTESLIAFLVWDKIVQVFHGDGNASF